MVIHTFRDGQGGHILHQGPDGGNIGDVGAVAAPCGDTLALLGRQHGNGTVGPLLPFRSLDGDGQQALLRQFRQLWQFHHVVNRPAQELIEGVGENVGGGFVTVEPDIVAVAVGGGAAKEQGGLSLGGGGGKGGIGLVEASVFQRVAVRYGLLGGPGRQLPGDAQNGGVVQGERGIGGPEPLAGFVQGKGQGELAVFVRQRGVGRRVRDSDRPCGVKCLLCRTVFLVTHPQKNQYHGA